MTSDDLDLGKVDIKSYLWVILFRWKIVAVCMLWFLLGSVVYLQVAKPQFLTRCTVMIWRDPSLSVETGARQPTGTRNYSYMLRSRELQEEAVHALRDKWISEFGSLRRMRLDIEVAPIRGQRSLLGISVKNDKPRYAREYLRTIWAEFEKQQRMFRDKTVDTSTRALKEELDVLRERISQEKEELDEFALRNQMELTAARGSVENRYIMGLLTYQNRLNTEVMLLEALFPVLKNLDATVIHDSGVLTREAGIVAPVDEGVSVGDDSESSTRFQGGRVAEDSPEILEWQNKEVALMRLRVRERELLANFKPEHPEVKAIGRQIEKLEGELKIAAEVAFGRLRDRQEALRTVWSSLEAPISQWKNVYRMTGRKRTEYQRRQLNIGRQEAMYKDLNKRLHDLKISQELKSDHFMMVDSVRTEDKQVWPDAGKIMLMALILAAGSGVGLAVLAHFFDDKMQTIADVKSVLDVPFLGGVPHWARRGSDPVARPIVLDDNSSGAIEAYRALRTTVLSEVDKSGRKMVAFTSAESKEGKTLTVLNLAVMMAQADKKVLLVDMDLRRPRVHRSLGGDRTPGMTAALAGRASLADVVRKTDIPNLWFAPGGKSDDDAAELLQSTDMGDFFAKAREEYDYILIDTPPVLRATDVSIIAGSDHVATVMVICVNRTPKPLIKYSLDMLKDARLLGAVMNNIDINKISSIYYTYQYPNYAYYAYAYAYGYDYDYYYGEGKGRRKPVSEGLKSRARRALRELRRTLMPME